MRRRPALAIALALAATAAPAETATFIPRFVWHHDALRFRGLSGHEFSADGSPFWVPGDKGTIGTGAFCRDRDGRISRSA